MIIIVIHIISALGSLFLAGLSLIRPTTYILRAAGLSVILTFLTGFGLVVSREAHLTQTCLSGLLYLAVVLPMLLLGRRKLGFQAQKP